MCFISSTFDCPAIIVHWPRKIRRSQCFQAAFATLQGQSATTSASLVANGTYTATRRLQPELSLIIQAAATAGTTLRGRLLFVVSANASWMQGPDGTRALAVGEHFGRGGEIFPFLLSLADGWALLGVGMTRSQRNQAPASSLTTSQRRPPLSQSQAREWQIARSGRTLKPSHPHPRKSTPTGPARFGSSRFGLLGQWHSLSVLDYVGLVAPTQWADPVPNYGQCPGFPK